MLESLTRRQFLERSLGTSMAVASASGSKEGISSAANRDRPRAAQVPAMAGLPVGTIGGIALSRLIVGGNPISANAHSRDLPYISSLMRGYFTDEKCVETLHLCEEGGINTAQLRTDSHIVRILKTYWREGGKLQWIAQIKPHEPDIGDIMNDVRMAFDNGAIGGYLQGQVADRLVQSGRVDLLGKALDLIRANGAIAGIGAHALEVVVACEEAGLEPDFYMKTLHRSDYWSAKIRPFRDNIWSATPDQTIAFMKKVKRPWIAFKVLAAGAIHPRDGFKYAFENGADFICVGMFDFQVRENVIITEDTLSLNRPRPRPWRA